MISALSPGLGPYPSTPGVFAAELLVDRLDADVEGRTLRLVVMFPYIPPPPL